MIFFPFALTKQAENGGGSPRGHAPRRKFWGPEQYPSEFDFRYNARDVSDAEREILAIEGTDGERLTYRDLSS